MNAETRVKHVDNEDSAASEVGANRMPSLEVGWMPKSSIQMTLG